MRICRLQWFLGRKVFHECHVQSFRNRIFFFGVLIFFWHHMSMQKEREHWSEKGRVTSTLNLWYYALTSTDKNTIGKHCDFDFVSQTNIFKRDNPVREHVWDGRVTYGWKVGAKENVPVVMSAPSMTPYWMAEWLKRMIHSAVCYLSWGILKILMVGGKLVSEHTWWISGAFNNIFGHHYAHGMREFRFWRKGLLWNPSVMIECGAHIFSSIFGKLVLK